MEHKQNPRAQATRERLRVAAHRLFLQRGYLATSIDAILAEAGISSKETLYRHYSGKEDLFVAVLSHLTLAQPGVSEQLVALPPPADLPALHQALTQLAREILALMTQPEYLALVRIIIAEAPRFPQLGALFAATVPQRAISLIMALLHGAREHGVIADGDYEAVTRALLGGLLTYAVTGLVMGDAAPPASPDQADALVEVVMRAVMPR